MRISTKMMYDRAIDNMNTAMERVTKARNQASNTKAFEYISDDPLAATQALSLKSTLEKTQSHLDTAHAVDDWMSASELAYKNVTESVKRALELGTGMLSETNGPQERRGAAIEMRGILDEVLEQANSNHNGSYLFAGYAVTTRPFSVVGGAADYDGDDGQILQDLDGHTVQMNADARAIFEPMLNSLNELADALDSNVTTDIDTAMGHLLSATDTFSQARTLNGSRQRQVRLSISNLEKTQLELQKMISEKEDANMVEALSRLKLEETAFETVLEVEQRTISAMNLFDVLR